MVVNVGVREFNIFIETNDTTTEKRKTSEENENKRNSITRERRENYAYIYPRYISTQ